MAENQQFATSPETDSEITALAQTHLDAEQERARLLKFHRDTNLGRFLKAYDRLTKNVNLGRGKAWPATLAVAPHKISQTSLKGSNNPLAAQSETERAAPALVRDERHSRGAVRRILVGSVCLILILIIATLGYLLAVPLLEPLATASLARQTSGAIERTALRRDCLWTDRVLDATGAEMGLLRRSLIGDCESVPFSAAFKPDSALSIATAFGELEGQWQKSFRTFLGHDLLTYTVAGMSMAERALWARIAHLSYGKFGTDKEELWSFFPKRGSGPILSAYEALSGQSNAIDGLGPKITNLWEASLFVAHHLPTNQDRAHFISESLSVVAVNGGRELGGALAADYLFGHAPQGWAETCLFAAASGFPLDSRSERQDLLGFRIEKARTRAVACVRALAPEREVETELAKLEAWELPQRDVPRLHPALAITSADASALPASPDKGDRLRLTVSREMQIAARAAIRPTLSEVEGHLAGTQCFNRECAQQASYLITVAEINGDSLPLKVHLTNRHNLLFGTWQDESENHIPIAPAFGQGSQHKVLLALLAADLGEAHLCNRVISGISNVSGPTSVTACNGSSGRVSLFEALARSMNTPFVDLAIRHVDEARALEKALGFRGPPSAPGAIALGQGRTAPPERFMALVAALDRAARQETARTDGLSLLQDMPVQAVDLEAIGYGNRTAQIAAMALSAPLTHTAGTLRILAQHMREAGFTPGLGKSGTGETPAGEARQRGFTASAGYGDRRFVVHVTVASKDGLTPLGTIPTYKLAELAVAALQAAIDG